MAASKKTTLIGESERTPSAWGERVLALVIAWSAHEPWRIGEVAILARGGGAMLLGRGDDEDKERRLRFFRQRPTGMAPTPAIESPGISRRQLTVEAHDDHVRVEQVGRCPLLVNGERCEGADIVPGDVVQLKRELVLLCVQRAGLILPCRHFPREAVGAFGEPDAIGVIGESPAAWSLREQIGFAAKANTHALLTGESGSGKELAARGIHALSPEKSGPFLGRNAATLPAGLIDAELFGNAKNYPNPGMAERSGLVGEADGGALFLDEIGELPTELQSHLLRVLDNDGEYQRLGEARARRSSFRLLAATNREATALKHDLLARFSSRVELPPLSERREDVPLLARHLLLRAAKKSPELAERFLAVGKDGRRDARLTAELVEYLLRAPLAANARDIDGLLWRAMAESTGEVLELPASLRRESIPSQRTSKTSEEHPEPPSEDKADPSAEEIREAMRAAENSVTKAARALGLSSRFALYRLFTKYGIERDDADG